jgi:ferredoxin-NADP reductase
LSFGVGGLCVALATVLTSLPERLCNATAPSDAAQRTPTRKNCRSSRHERENEDPTSYGKDADVRARINEKREVAKGTLLVTFDLLGEEVDFTPGQYFNVTLPNLGDDDDKGLRRHITVVTSPNERGVLGFATRMRDSAFKRTLRELPIGSEVDIEPPEGRFGLPEDPSRPLVFVAGGIGITVFRSMLRYIHEERLPYSVTLIYSNRDRESTAFLGELRELEQALPDFRLVFTMTQDPSWEGETRKVDAEFVQDYLDDDLDRYTFLVAGPSAMAEGIQGALREAGVRDENVIAERYSGY